MDSILIGRQADFGIPAERYFFATLHENGPCDCVVVTIQMMAKKAKLQNSEFRISKDERTIHLYLKQAYNI